MLKLYKEDKAGIRYAECWVYDNIATTHTGIVGDTGRSRREPCPEETMFMERFRQTYTPQGYAPWPEERQDWVVLQWPMKTLVGSSHNRGIRDKAMNLLDELLGWAGLGHVDGFDMGKTANPKEEFALNVFCLVVDSAVAVRCILESLPQQLDCSRLKIASRKYDGDEYMLHYHAKEHENWFYL